VREDVIRRNELRAMAAFLIVAGPPGGGNRGRFVLNGPLHRSLVARSDRLRQVVTHRSPADQRDMPIGPGHAAARPRPARRDDGARPNRRARSGGASGACGPWRTSERVPLRLRIIFALHLAARRWPGLSREGSTRIARLPGRGSCEHPRAASRQPHLR